MYCRHCGARRAGAIDRDFDTSDERYRLVEQAPAYAGALRHHPRLGWGDLSMALGIFCVTLLIGFLGVTLGRTADDGTFAILFAIVSGFIAVVGLVVIGVTIARMLAPTRRVIAVLVSDDEGGGQRQTQRAARVRLRDGEERKVIADDGLLALLAVGDIGVAYLQRDRLVDFRWFDVTPATSAPAPALDTPGGRHCAPSCVRCAAPVTFAAGATCLYCGEVLPEPDLGEHEARLATIARAATAEPAAAPYDPRPSAFGPLVVLAVGVGGLYLAVRGLMGWMIVAEDWPWIWAVFAPFLPLTLVGAVWLWRRLGPRPPPQRVPALVLRRRRVVVATVNRRPVYGHRLTVLSGRGVRAEVRCDAEAWQALPPDAAAVLWLRAGALVAHRPLRAS